MMESLRSVIIKQTVRQKSSRQAEYLKSKIPIPKSKICFLSFFSLIRLAVFLARGSALMKLQSRFQDKVT